VERKENDFPMRFVAIASNGGAFDDQSYWAGYEAGRIEGVLSCGGEPRQDLRVRPRNLHQIDLIAMRYGYVLQVQADGPWAHIILTAETDDA